MPAFDKIVVITQKTALEGLIERFNTRSQARFYIEHTGNSFTGYEAAHDTYMAALEHLKTSLPDGVHHQFIDRSFLPNFLFGGNDLIVTLGRDGLVVNTAKYLADQPIVAINPDPDRNDGVLLPFTVPQSAEVLHNTLEGRSSTRRITMAKAEMNDGQVLYGVNDLFIGQRTHLSARYHLQFGDAQEDQSSSGIIVSTGAGSTGWFRSILTGAVGVVAAYAPSKNLSKLLDVYRFDWDADYVCFSVREPFISKTSAAQLIFGRIEGRDQLCVTSQMPQNGVIFSDGIESDYLEFNSGRIAQIGVAEKKVNLVVGDT
jgi:NAD kinase